MKSCALKKDEKGIALLFSLGILSLLLVLAVSFTASAVVELKCSSNNASKTTARLMAQSTINRVCGLMRYYDNVMCSHTASGLNIGKYDWIHRLGTTGVFYWEDDHKDYINWEFVTVDGKITSRIAYVVIPGGGVDPGDLVSSSFQEESWSSSLPEEARPGVNMHEINLRCLDSGFMGDYVAGFDYDTNGGGYDSTSTSWGSINSVFSAINLVGNTDAKRGHMEKMRNWFVIDPASEPEAFWLDDNNDGVTNVDTDSDTVNELYHRFNLARTAASWNGLQVANVFYGTDPATSGNFPVPSDEFNRNDSAYDGYCIPWLKNWTDAGKGNFPNGATRGRQIAANLIDYCDAYSFPTHDWGGDPAVPPSYVGLDKNPYLNEIRLRFEVRSYRQLTGGSGLWRYRYSAVQLVPKVEVVNMYDTAWTSLGTIEIKATIDATVNAGETVPMPLGEFNGTITMDAGDWDGNETVNATSYKRTDNIYDFGNIFPSGSYTPSPIQDMTCNYTIDSIELHVYLKNSAGELLDYAHMSSSTPIEIPSPTSATYVYVHFETDDPRQNHHQEDWTCSSSIGAIPTYWGSSQRNSVCAPNPAGADNDLETGATDPWDVSTAYIRNAPMQSPWELGAIHRGGKWETINLKKYNTSQGVKANGGGGLYADGDANILDQIKMFSSNISPKKLSLKTQQDELLIALLRGITVGNDYSNPGARVAGRQIRLGDDSSQATKIAKDIKSDSIQFFSRGAVANVSSLSAEGTQFGSTNETLDCDSKQEEIIGKIINLTSVNQSDYFTVVAMAQSVKDIGFPSGPSSINVDINKDGNIASFDESTFDYDGDNALTSTNISETRSGLATGTYDQFADEIIGSQKIRAEIFKDPISKKCSIIKMEYLE